MTRPAALSIVFWLATAISATVAADCLQLQYQVTCAPEPPGPYTLTLSLTNLTDDVVEHVFIFAPEGTTVAPDYVDVDPLPPGAMITLPPITLTGAAPDTTVCLTVSIHDAALETCCAEPICIPLPACDCLQITNEIIDCVSFAGDAVSFTFDLTNLSDDVVEHVFLFTPPGVTVIPDYVDVPTLLPGESIGLATTILGAEPDVQLCMLVSIHDEALEECCAETVCVRPPDCAACPGEGPCREANGSPGCEDAACCLEVCAVDPFCCEVEWDEACASAACILCAACLGDLDGDSVVGPIDLAILLAAWGEPGCADFDLDGAVDPFDLATLLANWGECVPFDFSVSLNEIRIDQPGVDTDEYIELRGDPGDSLDGLCIMVFGDLGAGNPCGIVEEMIVLSGYEIPASGLFLIAENPTVLGATADLVVPLNLENADNLTVLLVLNCLNNVLGEDLDQD
ncbi:MAG: hypothetical protein KDA25_00335, partial [Phycisphaerales bacterium]|nr:hypothetical protein [Phycisphaerales bacterium]